VLKPGKHINNKTIFFEGWKVLVALINLKGFREQKNNMSWSDLRCIEENND
jgi:hypothetical protein